MNETAPQSSNYGFKKSEKKVFYTAIWVSIIFVGKFTSAFMTHSIALFSDRFGIC